MNDADLGDNIDEEAHIVESLADRERRFQNDDAHMDPSRWWFASSAFPMIAGTLGPVASAFSICALVRPWRQHLVAGGDVTDAPFVKDPPWLTIVNAIQLAVAIVSNVFLLLNMARRVRFSIAQPITIIGWYISAICLLSLDATAGGPLLTGIKFPQSELIWSQAFYYGVWAAALYFIDASLMAVTFWGASKGHYSKDFELTASQRTLMLQTIMFLMYLLVGALVFSNIEDWNYLDAVYWANVTLFTVGFGDFSPTTTLARALMIPYALVGIISLGLVIGSIRSLILERGRRRVAARMEEKKRRRLVRTMTLKGEDDILQPIREDSELPRSESEKAPTTEFERRRAEFELMRKVQAQTEARRRWMAMAISFSTWIFLWLVGAVIFQSAEKPYQHWTYFDSFYFCFTGLTTIGYGDFSPISPCGKSFFVFWSLLALPTMTVLISNAGDTVVKFIRDGTLRLGNVTILPGEEDFIGNVKHILSKLTCGRVFPTHRHSAAPEAEEARQTARKQLEDFIFRHSDEATQEEDAEDAEGEREERRGRPSHSHRHDLHHGLHHGQHHEQHHQQNHQENHDENPERSIQKQTSRPRSNRPQHKARTASTFTTQVRRSLSRLRNPQEELPEGTDFHFLLISEIQVIASHLKEPEPHRYTFEEWAWYLRLIGEDERSPETHRKPTLHVHGRPRKPAPSKRGRSLGRESDSDTELTWSWVGNRSPLMGSQEESEWILERLMDRLRESLSAEGRRKARERRRAARHEVQEMYEHEDEIEEDKEKEEEEDEKDREMEREKEEEKERREKN